MAHCFVSAINFYCGACSLGRKFCVGIWRLLICRVITKQSFTVAPVLFQPLSSTMVPITDTFWSGEEVLCWDPGTVPYNSFPTVSIVLPVNKTAAFKLVISSQVYNK